MTGSAATGRRTGRRVGAWAVAILATGAATTASRGYAQTPTAEWQARDAQRRFESIRREHLPWTGGGGSGGRCDARIGRFCYWHGDTPDSAPPEPEPVTHARGVLLAQLDSAASAAPADDWIAGQRVRYLLEAGTPDAAVSAVSPCAATAWWCDALRGLAQHAAGRDGAALQAFDAALAEMPPGQRCEWTDLTGLLDDAVADRYRRVSCAERGPTNARLWWLAQPFYTLGPNDLRAEHFSRLTMAQIASTSVWPEAVSWGDDLRELFVRYGWPRWFERERPDMLSDGAPAIMGHDPQPSYSFFPDVRALDSAWAAGPYVWQPDAPRANSRYAPPYAEALEPVRVLLSRFRRGDSEVVVAAYDVRGDSVLGRARLRAGLVVTPDEQQQFVSEVRGAPARGGLAVTAPARPAIASVELFADSGRVAARRRQGLERQEPPRNGVSLSDILLFRAGGALPSTLEDAIPLAVPDASDRAGAQLGLFWEVYGSLNPGTTMRISLTVVRTGTGWWQRARRLFHLGAADTPIALRWQDVTRAAGGVIPEAVTVDLSRLEPGSYRVRLTVEVAGRPEVGMDRQLDVRR